MSPVLKNLVLLGLGVVAVIIGYIGFLVGKKSKPVTKSEGTQTDSPPKWPPAPHCHEIIKEKVDFFEGVNFMIRGGSFRPEETD